jgi:DNA-binding MarR family transcriptional regulator
MTIAVSSTRIEKKRKEAIRARSVPDRHGYFVRIAQARYALRKVFRLVDEQAKLAGLEPLDHQALIQIYGSPTQQLRVKELAERLDIAAAFASSVVTALQAQGLVSRRRGDTDQRVTFVAITPRGRQLLHRIDEQVKAHIDYFARQLDQDGREAVISIVMFYVGIALDVEERVRPGP